MIEKIKKSIAKHPEVWIIVGVIGVPMIVLFLVIGFAVSRDSEHTEIDFQKCLSLKQDSYATCYAATHCHRNVK